MGVATTEESAPWSRPTRASASLCCLRRGGPAFGRRPRGHNPGGGEIDPATRASQATRWLSARDTSRRSRKEQLRAPLQDYASAPTPNPPGPPPAPPARTSRSSCDRSATARQLDDACAGLRRRRTVAGKGFAARLGSPRWKEGPDLVDGWAPAMRSALAQWMVVAPSPATAQRARQQRLPAPAGARVNEASAATCCHGVALSLLPRAGSTAVALQAVGDGAPSPRSSGHTPSPLSRRVEDLSSANGAAGRRSCGPPGVHRHVRRARRASARGSRTRGRTWGSWHWTTSRAREVRRYLHGAASGVRDLHERGTRAPSGVNWTSGTALYGRCQVRQPDPPRVHGLSTAQWRPCPSRSSAFTPSASMPSESPPPEGDPAKVVRSMASRQHTPSKAGTYACARRCRWSSTGAVTAAARHAVRPRARPRRWRARGAEDLARRVPRAPRLGILARSTNATAWARSIYRDRGQRGRVRGGAHALETGLVRRWRGITARKRARIVARRRIASRTSARALLPLRRGAIDEGGRSGVDSAARRCAPQRVNSQPWTSPRTFPAAFPGKASSCASAWPSRCPAEIARAGQALAAALQARPQGPACGNGGSARTASTFARRSSGVSRGSGPGMPPSRSPWKLRAHRDRQRLRFRPRVSQAVEAPGQGGPSVLAISTRAFQERRRADEAAQATGVVVSPLTGRDGGEMGRICGPRDFPPEVRTRETMRVQEIHGGVVHCLCGWSTSPYGEKQ